MLSTNSWLRRQNLEDSSGEIKDKVNIEANLASKSAVEKLEKIGGSIQLKK